jgi:hypothetical protein
MSRKVSGRDRFNDQMRELKEKAPLLRSPSDLTEVVSVPNDLAMAFATGRVELLKLAQPRAMDADEVATLYNLIRVLLETNIALREHAEAVAQLAYTVHDNLRGVVGSAALLEAFADFRATDDAEEEDALR